MAYAVGEIALIMAGILLALQVSEWNQGRKDRNLEDFHIERIIADLGTKLSRLENGLGARKRRNERFDIAHALLLGNDTEVSDPAIALAILFNAGRGNPTRLISDTYDELRETGKFNIISNSEIRYEIDREAKGEKQRGQSNYS